MDEAFSNLDDLSDKETLERLESLFETNSLPPVSWYSKALRAWFRIGEFQIFEFSSKKLCKEMSNWTTTSNWMSNRNTAEDIFDDVMERTNEDQTDYVS